LNEQLAQCADVVSAIGMLVGSWRDFGSAVWALLSAWGDYRAVTVALGSAFLATLAQTLINRTVAPAVPRKPPPGT
jgi:hypothetical protein